MNKQLITIIVIVILLGVGFLVFKKDNQPSELTTIRIGWQIGWVPQAQLAQVLKHTDILETNGLRGEFKSFSYG